MSNILKQKNFMPGATVEELKDHAVVSTKALMDGLYNLFGMNDNIFVTFLCGGIRLGVYSDGKISEKEMSLITAFFNEICPEAPLEELIGRIEGPMEPAYKVVKDLFNNAPKLGLTFCYFIMCFGYVDGDLEDEVSQKLSDIITDSGYTIRSTEADGEEDP